jgi:hypothetical protein
MIDALLCISLLGYCILAWRAEKATSVASSDQRAAPVSLPAGPEDDPVWWPAARGGWSALDERQLIRLLTDSAP